MKTIEYYMSLDYPVEIRRIDPNDGGGYIATIPFLGAHAFVGDGETPQEAYDNLEAAKAEIFEDYISQGLPIPEPPAFEDYEDYSGKLVVRMPKELHARLASAAKQNNTSLNQFIVYALSSFEAKLDILQGIQKALPTTGTGHTTYYNTGSVARRNDVYDQTERNESCKSTSHSFVITPIQDQSYMH
jgi:antitoxin HicB